MQFDLGAGTSRVPPSLCRVPRPHRPPSTLFNFTSVKHHAPQHSQRTPLVLTDTIQRNMTTRACLLAVATMGFFPLVVADWDPIAGYTPVSDVIEHSELDLDMLDMEIGADNQTEAGFLAAWKAYSEGGNSEKTDSIRTIRGFSTSAQEKMSTEPWFKIYRDYWGEPDYADLYTTAACNGTDSFAGLDPVIRAEGCVKGAQYQNVWMYVIHELEDAISDCINGDLTANDGGPHAWDEGWAFYAGSQEDGSGSGVMPYALAEKRCAQFGTCTGDDDGSSVSGTSYVNMMLLDLYHDGQEKLLNGECDEVETIKEEIVRLMTIPLMQGLLRYVYISTTGGDKEAAELWAFSAAVLPQIDNCNQDVATTIRSNTDIASSDAPISEGYVTIKQKLESVYSCMNIACSEVGGLMSSAGTYLSGMEPCTDSNNSNNSNSSTDNNSSTDDSNSGSETDGDNDNDNDGGYTPRTVNDDESESDSGSDLEDWAIAVIVLVVLAVLGVVVYFYLQRRRNRSATSNFAAF